MASLLNIALVGFAGFFVLVNGSTKTEPLCLSRYDYDYKMLQKTFALEQEQKDLRQLMDKQAETIRKQDELIIKIETSLRDDIRRIETSYDRSVPGSTFVRWGRTMCPENGTETVYNGYVGGSHFNDQGAAVNYLCLPANPVWDKFDDNDNGHHPVYGAEYEIFGSYAEVIFNTHLANSDPPCAVCHSVRGRTLMIPGRNTCYDGWTMEYSGYLAAGHETQKAATEFVCLDKDPEVIAGSQVDQNGKLFYLVEASCGSLKCPPYVQGRELTCVVCTR